jgi:ABC-type Fe3+/spermidine/putrescine transport system ATPase subunit
MRQSTTLRDRRARKSAQEKFASTGSDGDVPPKDRDIAMVFQNYALYPHMTVAEICRSA